MPHGEKIHKSDWEKMQDRRQNSSRAEHSFLSPVRQDAVTSRALAALGADSSSDQSEDGTARVAPLSDHNRPLQISLDDRSEKSQDTMPTEQVKPSEDTNSQEDQPEQQEAIQSDNTGTSGAESRSRSSQVVDLTLDSSDDEDEVISQSSSKPSVEVPKSSPDTTTANANNTSQPPVPEQKKCNNLKILDETLTTKPIPSSERLPFLSGTLSVNQVGTGCQLVFRGVWGYQKTPEFTPQRFELISDLTSAGANIESPFACKYHGSFIYNNAAIDEKDVHLKFVSSDDDSASYTVKGYGSNQFGGFELNGSAKRLTKSNQVSYSLMLTKIYVDPPVLPSAVSKKRKRNLSETSSTESIDSIQNGKRRSTQKQSDGGLNAIASPPQMKEPFRRKGPTLFDQVESAQTRPNSRRKKITLPTTSNRNSPDKTVINNINWQEFGELHSPQKEKQHTLWRIRDVVGPSFPKITIDFCDSENIHFVNDLLKADVSDLCAKLMINNGFRAACAIAAWKSRQRFHDVYKLSLAKQSIEAWKGVAEKWWRKTCYSSWYRKEVRTSTFLSESEASFLEKNFGIVSADQLLLSSHQKILQTLQSNHLDGVESTCDLWEGMFCSWMMRAQEKASKEITRNNNTLLITMKKVLCGQSISHTHSSTNGKKKQTPLRNAPHSSQTETIQVYDQFATSTPINSMPPSTCNELGNTSNNTKYHSTFKTPMSCVDFLFIRSQGIINDEQLSQINVSDVTSKYLSFLQIHRYDNSSTDIKEVVFKLKNDALEKLGMDFEVVKTAAPLSNRIDKSSDAQVMYTISHLSRTTTSNNGLPSRTIYTFDDANDALYRFRVDVRKSRVPNSGNGAFLTYEGCSILKQSSHWKKKSLSDIPQLPQTRKPLTAVFVGKGSADVTLKGKHIHCDENFYGPENGIGTFNEYTLDDFTETKNITFSSKHFGCCLVELDRYAPLLPEDRKVDFIFGMKDFIFSYEPSSWIFNVEEDFNGHRQAVDFTDDTTGSPHSVAQSHVAMYVNEVGHDETLVENVRPLETPRSVSYYAFIDQPMHKGEEVELLVDYGPSYEDMRQRRGYGKLTSNTGMQSDEHNVSRVRRNMYERLAIEDSVVSLDEEELALAIDFFENRVWDGLKTLNNREGDISTLRRQRVAMRRLHWLAGKFQARLLQLCANKSKSNDDVTCDGDFYVGMFVFINDWMPKDDPRPAYSGIATITAIAKDKFDRCVFDVSIPSSQKSINNVPEGAVTLPTKEDFSGMTSTVVRTWEKQKQQKRCTRLKGQMFEQLAASFQWDSSYIHHDRTEVQETLIKDYHWELSEELLYLLTKHNRLVDPFDNTKFCQLSQTLLEKLLHSIADYTISNKNISELLDKCLLLASDTATSLNEMESSEAILKHLSFRVDSSSEKSVLIVKSIKNHKIATEEFLQQPQELDIEWYLCFQVVLVAHPLLSLITWRVEESQYSLQLLCDRVGLDYNCPYLTVAHSSEAFTPLISLD